MARRGLESSPLDACSALSPNPNSRPPLTAFPLHEILAHAFEFVDGQPGRNLCASDDLGDVERERELLVLPARRGG